MERIQDISLNIDDAQHTIDAILDVQELVFGGVLEDENPAEVLKAISAFSRGYPGAPNRSTESGPPLYSFEYDLNEIIIAIRNQSGIDLSYRRKEPFHWWEFLLEFHTLCGSHYILNLMDVRGYKGKDKEILRRKYACALPERHSIQEQAELDAWSDMMGTNWENIEGDTE